MFFFRILPFLLILVLAAPAGAQDKVFNAETFTLTNGMEVVVIPNRRAPVVTHMVWYRVGAADDPPGQSGIAHFVEHLMFKGTKDMPPGEFSKRVKSMGGNDNAFTGHNSTAYFQSISVGSLEAVMKMEADRMLNLTFPPDEVLSERKVVIEERRERTENDPRGYFQEQMRAALFVNHPYANPPVGWFHEVGALERENVKDFYGRWYAPNNAILIVTGDITAKELRPLAERIYGAIPRRDAPARQWTDVPPLLAKMRLTLHHKSIRQPMLSRLYRVPSCAMNRDECLALQVLESILDGGSATRLYKELVVQKKMAVSAGLSYQGSAVSDGTVSASLIPAADVDVEELEWAFDDVLRNLISNGITEDELRTAKDRLKDEAIFARDSLMGPAMIFGQALVASETIDDIEFWPDNIEKVTARQVNDVAHKYLNPDDYGTRPYVTGYLLPPARSEKKE
ncbi:MAG: insulinase family protein [Proteobacteria bacterium]|nr:insulinase family protein [Pseudomonadota bacterium]